MTKRRKAVKKVFPNYKKGGFFMKTILKILLITCIAIIAAIATIAVSAVPTASDEEIIAMFKEKGEVIDNVTMDTVYEDDVADVKMDLNTEVITCPHFKTSVKTINATCLLNGIEETICNDCGEVIKSAIVPKLSHTTTIIKTKATCVQSGEIKTVCTVCNTILNKKVVENGNHSSLVLIKEVVPTPFADGYRIHKCNDCKKEITITLKFWQNGKTNLYIPALGINCSVNMGECNQANTDDFDVSCDINFINENNPLFFGHSTGTLGELYKLQIGDMIYFTINGEANAYKVIVSEEGFTINGGANIKGKETGTLCINSCQNNTLHFFTCHSTIFNHNTRWIVLAEKV